MTELDGDLAALDVLATDLQALRVAAGSPSYAEIVLRIAAQRQARGVPEAESRPGRTTVYDAFRTGRRRLDTHLVLEIVRALGADDAQVAAWTARCQAPGRQLATPEPVRAPIDPPRPPVWSARPDLIDVGDSDRLPGRRRMRLLGAVLVLCLAANLLGRLLVDLLGLPLYLDMPGTAFAAIALGPWWGALVGMLTNLLGALTSGWVSLPFGLVNVAGALIWGYGVRRYRAGSTIPRFFVLNVAVGVACSIVAVPILMLVFDGIGSHAADDITQTMVELSDNLLVSVTSSNLLTSISDKLISGFAVLALLEALRTRRR